MLKSKILFQLTGSIACYKACDGISKLVQRGHEVRVVATANALQFVGAATLEGLTGHPVFSDVFERGRMMDHIELAKWAQIAVVCPASANTINQLAAGVAANCVGSIFLAFDLQKPYLIFPAMNQEMYKHPATQKSLATLESYGVRVFSTGVGHQACGDVGPGRLLESEQIVESIEGCAK